jgi:hypothetical protein
MVIRDWDESPRQWSMALRINSRAVRGSAWTGPANSNTQRQTLIPTLQLFVAMAYNSELSPALVLAAMDRAKSHVQGAPLEQENQ